MTYLWATLLILLNTLWLATVVAGLPGTWLMVVCTALLAWWKWEDPATGQAGMFSLATLITIVVLAAIGEIAEFFTGVVGSKKAGGTRRGAIGALIGCLVGAVAATFLIPIPILGSLIGACGGACLGAWGFELSGGRRMAESARSGVGAGVGTFAGRVVKLIVGIAIWLIVAVAALWP
ncbi:MAG: DUF456 domain-containing protein [Planctomycetes bacterium]|nr:DUF456 domain-containing protein [Planctomycetota bacterium]